MRIMLPLLVTLLAFSLSGFCQAEEPDILGLARETMARVPYPALITLDEQGQPRARTVEAFSPDENFVVWIATRPNTRKVAQIRQHNRVTLYYFDAERRNYVTIMGQARLVDDDQVKARMRRSTDTDRLYPAFPEDYLLIEVTPHRLEGILPGYRGDPDNWAPAGFNFRPD
ncbi:MAG: pyridoxamine 5'-phosphate oxidase family protein [Pseudomonadota bacterium]